MATAQARLNRQIKMQEAQVTGFLSRLNLFLNNNLEDILGGVVSGETSAIESARILGSLQDELINLGLNREVGNLQAIYADELRSINDEFAHIGNVRPFAEIDLNTIEALVNFDIERVTGQVQNYVDDIRSTLIRNVLTGETPNFTALRDDLGNKLVSNLETEINTGLMGFNRSVTVSKAQDLGFDSFEYLGPDDKITRPFCQKVLEDRSPPVYTLAEIQAMKNKQGLPVLTYGGGYNCRHIWRPVANG